jgi:5-methylcytosine-specific restriction protein A
MLTGAYLNKLLGLGAEHALYRQDGGWYHHLKKFPGILFDFNGYIRFHSATEYLICPYLKHNKDLNVSKGISRIPGYIYFTAEQKRKVITNTIDEITDETIRILRQYDTILRSAKLVREVKSIYDDSCQICGIQLKVSSSLFYSEVHHIKPLGRPHNGPDKIENMMCVCPNHHVLLDLGTLGLELNALALIKHEISADNVLYHNSWIKL